MNTINAAGFCEMSHDELMQVDGGFPWATVAKWFFSWLGGNALNYVIAHRNEIKWGVAPNDPCRQTALWKIYIGN